ncbi:P-loop ATPase, Sll1717 family [Jatrophihabitans endophyticus]|uniref:P-loop ATPase, Sll1717 family n=1 Tax=Jatrophihabitans endophyticus TaxID=1206085 RepID=UPI001160EEC5|nr:hypothetical protein [Jatrophihabitans endophyticus]
MREPGLGQLYFGMAAAENEVADNPDRFLATYQDRWSLMPAVEQHKRFLILGPKGTGKSAAAHYIRLAWVNRFGAESVFPTFVDFDELNRTQSPLASMDKHLVGDVTALTDAAWRLFIGVRLLDSLLRDQACYLNRDPQVSGLVEQLRVAGLASDDFPQVLRRVRERKGGFALPGNLLSGSAGSQQSDQVPVNQLGDALLRLVIDARTSNRHILAIDGLDKAIGDNPAYWQTLAALVRVADSLTRDLRSAGAEHVFVLVMCRSDVFRRVRFSDAAKISADGGVHMDWGAEAEDPADMRLWDYIADKAQTSKDELLAYLPRAVRVGVRQRVEIRGYLQQFTRYTPRDMTLLFTTLQEVRPEGHFTNSQVRRAVDNFSTRHLLTEIMSEATGLLPESMIDRFEAILSGLPQRIFSRSELEEALSDSGFTAQSDVDRFGEYAFLQGAIGNYRPGAGYVQFYHRRDAYKWQKQGPWIMNTGLVYAFNIPWTNTLDRRSNPSTPASGHGGVDSTTPARTPRKRTRRGRPS